MYLLLNTKIKRVVYAVSFVAIVALAFWLSELVGKNNLVQNIVSSFGYIGVFGASIISGFNLVVPVPAIAFLPALLEAGLNFWITIIIITLGMTLGDSIGYVIGRTGRKAISPITMVNFMNRLEHIENKYHIKPTAFLFIYASLVPLPNEIMVIPLGFLGYKFKQLFMAVFAGNLIFNGLSAFGLINLFRLF
ncbi:MAG: VTT domain-containing protein [bacterium]|nr:VTT domain-containing protein [bacterium]